MTYSASAEPGSSWARHLYAALPGRLLRLELRRSAMLWMLPIVGVLFWLGIYRRAMDAAPLWSFRIMRLERDYALQAFGPFVAGAAAWMGSREGRRGTIELVNVTARPRWAARLVTWGATTGYAIGAYLCCVAIFYAINAGQVAWGGPPLWPAAVGITGVAAFSALGFATGALVPSRFTAPLAATVAFLALLVGQVAAQHNSTYALISPLGVPAHLPPDAGNFFPYLPDLSIAQMMFFAGLTVAGLGAVGLASATDGRWLRRVAVVVTAAGLACSGTALGLAGTARIGANGIVIPALHNAASDREIRFTPTCIHRAVPVCVHPAYQAYVQKVGDALDPVLSQVAGLPGAPVRVAQAPTFLSKRGVIGAASISGSPPVLYIPLGSELQAQTATADLVDQIKIDGAPLIVDNVIGIGTGPGSAPGSAAQQAVAAALLKAAGMQLIALPQGAPPAGTPAYAAMLRFAALTPQARRAWLADHLTALRAGQISPSEVP
jgi:hypothetical protein